MANRGFRSRVLPAVRGGGGRRETRWLDVPATDFSLASPSSAALALSLTAEELALRPFTVVRSRLTWVVRSDQFVATEGYEIAIGMAVVSDQALAIGVTAVPTPFTDLSSDLWLLHDIQMGFLVFGTGVGFQERRAGAQVDSKAMRKVEDGQDLVVVIENASTSLGTLGTVAGRVLVKLH